MLDSATKLQPPVLLKKSLRGILSISNRFIKTSLLLPLSSCSMTIYNVYHVHLFFEQSYGKEIYLQNELAIY